MWRNHEISKRVHSKLFISICMSKEKNPLYVYRKNQQLSFTTYKKNLFSNTLLL